MSIPTIEQVKARCLKTPHRDAPTSLKIGDKVTFTNPAGVEFTGLTVIGFCNPADLHGRSVHLNFDCYWFPVALANLTKDRSDHSVQCSD